MTETRQYIGFGDVERFLVKSYKCITGGREFDIDKYGPYVDAVKHVLVPSLEKQILFCLERFVYNEDVRQSSYQPYLSRYKESMLTACAKYNEIGSSIEAMRHLITIDHMVDFLGLSLLTTNRLVKIGDDLDSMGIEKNLLGYLNVLNYINEKDFWVCSSSLSNSSGQYSSICSPSNDNILSDILTTEKGSHFIERTRGQKRPRKRAATHISRKHYKLERLAQLSDKSFRVTESLYDLLKSNWDLHDSLHTKRRLKRDCGDLRRCNFASYNRKHRKTHWKSENLAFFVRKLNDARTKHTEKEDQRNSEVRTSLSLPCKVEQLLLKLDKVDSSLIKFHCSFIKKKFQTKVYNVCSCLNNLLSRMDRKTINSIYLLCEIRKDYLSFKLRQTPTSRCNSSLFSARVMTCEALCRYGMRKSGSRQKLKSQSFWAAKKADELSTGEQSFVLSKKIDHCKNTGFAKDEVISSIEISFDNCDGAATDQQKVAKGLACSPGDFGCTTLRDSLSISDVVQKLELSPFRLQETEQSLRIRSKVRDIVRSIMVCTQKHSTPGTEGRQSISIEATLSTSSFHGIKHREEVLPVESASSKALSVSKIVSFIESKIFSSKSKETIDCKKCTKLNKPAELEDCAELTGSTKSRKSVNPKSCRQVNEQGFRCKGSVKPKKNLQKFRASSSSREPYKLKNKNKYKICTTSEKPVRSKEFTGSHGRLLSEKMEECIASGISNALARTKPTGSGITDDENDYEIAVTVEIEDSSQSSDDITDSISRHTHILPSMKTVKLGTCIKYFPHDYATSTSSSSSLASLEDEIVTRDNFTTMNKSMISNSNRGTISAKSYDRMKHLIREKVCKKLSETDSCQPNSSKTIISSRKYYLSIPSSKTSRVLLKREISESSSTSCDGSQLPVCCNRRRQTPKYSSSDDERLLRKSLDCYYADSETQSQSSVTATFDKNSTYGCIEDRLANRYFREIVDDYSDEAGDSPRYKHIESQISYGRFPEFDDWGPRINERKECASRYYDSEVSSEQNRTSLSRVFETEEDAQTNVSQSNYDMEDFYQYHPEKKFTTYVVGRAIVQGTPRLDDFGRFEEIQRTRRPSGWSTCAIRSSSSIDCPDDLDIYPTNSNCRLNMRDRGDSPQQKTFTFGPFHIIEKYKKRFQNIDKSFRAKVLQYVGLCKNAKSNFRSQICLDDIYEASVTSIPPSNSRRHKRRGDYFGG